MQKKEKWLSSDLSSTRNFLLSTINIFSNQLSNNSDDIIRFSNPNLTLKDLYRRFLSLCNNENHLLNEEIFDDFIFAKIEGLRSTLKNNNNKHFMNSIKCIYNVGLIAKDNHISKECLYEIVSLFTKTIVSDNLFSQPLCRKFNINIQSKYINTLRLFSSGRIHF